MSVLLDLHLFQNRIPRYLVLLGNRLHQRLDKVLGWLNAKNGQYCSLGLNPQCLLICVGISDASKPVCKLKRDRVISCISEFVTADGGDAVQFAEDGTKGIVTFRSLRFVSKTDIRLVK